MRAELDRSFAARVGKNTQSLQQEIWAVRTPFVSDVPFERYRLYSLSKEKSEIDGLIARKTEELNQKNIAARSYDGHDALIRTLNDYLQRLEAFGEALSHGHHIWENAYGAAHEARLLSTQLDMLYEKSNALAREHASAVRDFAVWESIA